MRFILTIIFCLIATTSFAQLPPPPVMQGQNTQTIQYLQNVYDNHNLLQTVTQNPNNNRLGRYGDMIRYKESSTSFVIYTCISSPMGKAWQAASETCHGIPPGGTASQALVKLTNNDYDVYWADISSFVTTTHSETFTSNTTFTASAGIATVFITGVGGGGGGGGAGAGRDGGGGESGHALVNYPYAVTAGATYAIVIGTGGAGGTTNGGGAAGNDGVDGTDSSFGGVVIMKGGRRGFGSGKGGYAPEEWGISVAGRGGTVVGTDPLTNAQYPSCGGGGVFASGGTIGVAGGDYGGGGGGGLEGVIDGQPGGKGMLIVSW